MNNQAQKTPPQQFSNFVIFKIDNSKVNIDENELNEKVVCRDFRHTTQHANELDKKESKR